MNRWLPSLVILITMALAGCEVTSRGDSGQVDFTPTNCGVYAVGCSFSRPIFIGGVIDIKLASKQNLDGHELTVEDTTIAQVAPIFQSAGGKDWELTAKGVGTTRLLVVDATGAEIDSLTIETTQADRLSLAPILSGPDGLVDIEEGKELWTIEANKEHKFQVGPDLDDDTLGMGRMTYIVASETSPEILASIDTTECEATEGCILLNLPPGTFDLIVMSEDGTLSLHAVITSEEVSR